MHGNVSEMFLIIFIRKYYIVCCHLKCPWMAILLNILLNLVKLHLLTLECLFQAGGRCHDGHGFPLLLGTFQPRLPSSSQQELDE